MSTASFKPAWWLWSSHLQTIWPTLFRRSIHLSLYSERFELPDGDFVDLTWTAPTEGPIVLILHGFEGSIESPYAKGMLNALNKQGWRGVLMHFRGCSGEHNRMPRSYHSGDTDDLAFVIHALKKRAPNVPIAAVGFSLGGNVLLKWLGETGKNNPLTAAVAVSVPFELHKAVKRIQLGFSRLYEWYLLNQVCRRLSHKFRAQPPPFKMPVFKKLKSLYHFDDQVTAPLHGFQNAFEYYEKASSRQYLSTIEVPTLIVNAKDDPFLTKDMIPEMHELSETVQLELTEEGGHVGFIGGTYPWTPHYWLEERVPLFLKERLNEAF